jgi:hypothetical protein
MNTIKEYAKAVTAAVVPLLSIALVVHVEQLADLSTEWKAVIVAAITSLATAIVPNQHPAPAASVN